MSEWRDISEAPRDGTWFFAWQEGEIYVACYTTEGPPRLCWRTHSNFVHSKHHLINAEFEGKQVKAHLPYDEPWTEEFRHDWTLWTRGFDFKPTLFMYLQSPPSTDHQAQSSMK